MVIMRCITHERWLILLVLCPPGWHCEEGTYQDSWFLSNCQDHSKPCMPSSYISGVEYIWLCKSRPTPSHLSACMLVTVASNLVRGSIVRWLPSLSEQVWINAILQLPCVKCFCWTCFTQFLLLCSHLLTELFPCFLHSIMPRLFNTGGFSCGWLWNVLLLFCCRWFSCGQ